MLIMLYIIITLVHKKIISLSPSFFFFSFSSLQKFFNTNIITFIIITFYLNKLFLSYRNVKLIRAYNRKQLFIGLFAKTLNVLGNDALSKQINVKCSFVHPRYNEIRLRGIGTILFPSSLDSSDTRCKRSGRNKGLDQHGIVIYRNVEGWLTLVACDFLKWDLCSALSSRG